MNFNPFFHVFFLNFFYRNIADIGGEKGFTPWTPWSKCSVECNGGYTTRERECLNTNVNEITYCKKGKKESISKSCNQFPCLGSNGNTKSFEEIENELEGVIDEFDKVIDKVDEEFDKNGPNRSGIAYGWGRRRSGNTDLWGKKKKK